MNGPQRACEWATEGVLMGRRGRVNGPQRACEWGAGGRFSFSVCSVCMIVDTFKFTHSSQMLLINKN